MEIYVGTNIHLMIFSNLLIYVIVHYITNDNICGTEETFEC